MKYLAFLCVAILVFVLACSAFQPTTDPKTGQSGPAPVQTYTQPLTDAGKGTPLQPYTDATALLINAAVAIAAAFTTHKVKDKIEAAKASNATPKT